MFWIAQKHPPLIRSFFLPIYAMLAAALEIPARRWSPFPSSIPSLLHLHCLDERWPWYSFIAYTSSYITPLPAFDFPFQGKSSSEPTDSCKKTGPYRLSIVLLQHWKLAKRRACGKGQQRTQSVEWPHKVPAQGEGSRGIPAPTFLSSSPLEVRMHASLFPFWARTHTNLSMLATKALHLWSQGRVWNITLKAEPCSFQVKSTYKISP